MGAIATSFDIDYTRAVQKGLCEKLNTTLVIDGDFGPKSVAALKDYQQKCMIPVTGVYDQNTQSALEPFILSKFVTRRDFDAAALALTVSLPKIKAVQETESKGAGFLPNGRVKILFERHKFYDALVKRIGLAKTRTYMVSGNTPINTDILNTAPGGYVGDMGEWAKFNRAFAIDPEAAMLSASYGMFQIMGFNYEFCGYKTVGAYVDDMKLSEMKHMDAFVSFIKKYASGQLWTALKAGDWVTFARIYNGTGQVPYYSAKMKDNFTLFAKIYG